MEKKQGKYGSWHERVMADRARHIRERSGFYSMEWIQSALFLYVAHQEGLGEDLHRAVWAYTAAMVDKLERLLTDSGHITGAEDIAEEYKWTVKQLRIAITKHLGLLKMFEGQPDVVLPEVDDVGSSLVDAIHEPSAGDAQAATRYVQTAFRREHPGYEAVIPVNKDWI